MKHELSVLIPVFNCRCRDLTESLHRQLRVLPVKYEIIVADDGSTDTQVIAENRSIKTLENVRLIERNINSGRAKIRNFLAREAQHSNLLFLDGDMSIEKDDFIANYIKHDAPVVYGGYDITHNDETLKSNLRYRYERKAEGNHSAAIRSKKPYNDFHTSNFMTTKEIMTRFPFDERLRHYGYEDVLWGKTLRDNGIVIKHIDNPLTFADFETNDGFVRKTEEGLRTLRMFKDELQGYSSLLEYERIIRRLHLVPLMRRMFRLLRKTLLHNLESNNPSIFKFNIYKLLYFLNEERGNNKETK
ncbi:glycosyltransferase family 2 protein [Prevotella sp. OH937_COT-195]|uniref:glycosyltransferase family 2 protein n=1 Tax=Prevotella sp. OH937_COT-195 TaxID=2491051 RepID=UPI000F64F99E|nr:glycosyltransferase family 2 protein [Prevotella sp. OH937_COT-195]RRC99869.1 glycosyltransferase family 2 protein [Prevotella sp. OH937_COT-195]